MRCIASSFYGGSQLDLGRSIAVGPQGEAVVLGTTQSADFPVVNAQRFTRWTPGVNFEHTFLAVFGRQLERVTSAAFVGDERYLPNVALFKVNGGYAYVAGQVTTVHGRQRVRHLPQCRQTAVVLRHYEPLVLAAVMLGAIQPAAGKIVVIAGEDVVNLVQQPTASRRS